MFYNYRIFLIVPLLVFSTSFFHINGFFTFGVDYHTFIITSNHIWDETTHYLLTPIRFIELGDLSFKSLETSEETFYFIKDFFSTIQNLIFYFFFDLKYIGLILDLFSIFLNFILFFIFFRKVFKFDLNYCLIFSVLSIIFFGYGPQTYREIIGFISFEPFSPIPTLTRHEPTANTNVGFLISLTGLYFFYIKKNYRLFFLTSLIGFFSYIYVSLFYISLCGVTFIFEYLIKKKNFFSLLKNFAIPIIIFLTWVYLMVFMDSEGNLRNTQHISNSINSKFFIISIFYIFLNLLNYKYSKIKIIKNNSVFIILIFIACNICFYSTLITKVDLGGNDHFNYFANPFQWITIFNIIYNFKSKISINLNFYLLIILIVIQFVGVKKYSDKYFKENNENIIKQVEYTNDLQILKHLIKDKTVITLDPFFVWYGFNLTSSYSFIPNHLDLSVSSDDIIKKFFATSKFFELSENDVIEYFFQKPNISKRSINFEEIVFAGDLNDGFYEALNTKKLSKLDLINFIKGEYKETKVANNNNELILINKDWHVPNKKFFENLELLYENNIFMLLKTNE